MFKTLTLVIPIFLISTLSVQADNDGYVFGSGNSVVHDGSGDCVYTNFWDPQDAIAGCDAVVSEVESKPIEFAAVEPAAPKPSITRQVTLDAKTHFDFDKATLKPAGREALDSIIASLGNLNELLEISIAGHADRIGDASYNQQLALERAMTVRDYLSQHGSVDPNLLKVVSMGEDDPLVSCEGLRGQPLIDCLEPNRRAEVTIKAIEVE